MDNVRTKSKLKLYKETLEEMLDMAWEDMEKYKGDETMKERYDSRRRAYRTALQTFNAFFKEELE